MSSTGPTSSEMLSMSNSTATSTSSSMTKGTLKSEQLVPLLDYLLKKELEKMKIAEFLENLQHLQDKFHYMDKLEGLRIDDEIEKIKQLQSKIETKVNQCFIDLQNTIKIYDEKQNARNVEENIYRLDVEKEIEEIKKQQENINGTIKSMAEDHKKLMSEQESSKIDLIDFKNVQQQMKVQHDTMTDDQKLLKIEHDKFQKYHQDIKTDLESNKVIWSKVMELHQSVLMEREKMHADLDLIKSVQKSMTIDEGAQMKALNDKRVEDQTSIEAEGGTFKKEYQILKIELDETKNILQKVMEEQDKFRIECEKMKREKRKSREDRKRQEQHQITLEREKIRIEMEKIREAKERIQREQEKLKGERDKLFSYIARQQYGSQFDMPGPSSNCFNSTQRRENNVRPLLAIKPSEDSEANYDNVTFHFDDSDILYEGQTTETALKVESMNEDDENDYAMAPEDLPLISSCEDVSLVEESHGKFVQRYTVEEAESEKSSSSNEDVDQRLLVSMDFYNDELGTEDSLSD